MKLLEAIELFENYKRHIENGSKITIHYEQVKKVVEAYGVINGIIQGCKCYGNCDNYGNVDNNCCDIEVNYCDLTHVCDKWGINSLLLLSKTPGVEIKKDTK